MVLEPVMSFPFNVTSYSSSIIAMTERATRLFQSSRALNSVSGERILASKSSNYSAKLLINSLISISKLIFIC